MLFLPAALGVYMLTNSVLGIVQQLAVEKFAPRRPGPGGSEKASEKNGDIVVKQASEGARKPGSSATWTSRNAGPSGDQARLPLSEPRGVADRR